MDVTFDESQITLRQVVELLSSIHYIPDLSHSLSEKKEDTHSYKKLLLKMGVAGFVFINVMTYSLPAYFNGEPLEDNLQSLLSILSYILVIPVVFYSGSDYFISTYKNLRKKNVSIDLPIALGIFVLFGVSSYEILFTGGQGYCDSLSESTRPMERSALHLVSVFYPLNPFWCGDQRDRRHYKPHHQTPFRRCSLPR